METFGYFDRICSYQSQIAFDREMLENATSEQQIEYWQRALEQDENALERFVNGER